MTMHINERFSEILGNHDYDISLQAMEVDPTRVLGSLKMLMANRSGEPLGVRYSKAGIKVL